MTDQAPSTTPSDDVRMRGFARRTPVEDARKWVDAHASLLDGEDVPLAAAAGRVLAADVASSIDVPGFQRAMMDGFALHAADTLGASPYNRLELTIVGQAFPGVPFVPRVGRGQAVRIMTGAPVPAGADAVLPAERTEVQGERLYALGDVPPGKHVGRTGEDICKNTTVLRAGRILRPQDVGLLSSIGVSQPCVLRRVRVRIVATGNELLPPGTRPHGYQITDANSPMLAALVQRDGGELVDTQRVADEPAAILRAMQSHADVVLVSGGSSVGQEDHAPTMLAQHGELAIHGVAMRPASPAGMGLLRGRLVFLLPGNPVSCLCAYDFFAGRALRMMTGQHKEWPYRKRVLPLRRKLVSVVGRVDYARVSIDADRVEPIAISGASILSSATRADGFVVIPGDSEGYPPGREVEVYLYD